MSDKPILFSAPMIRALLDGRKTQTRRELKLRGHKSFSEFGPSTTQGYDWHFRRPDAAWCDHRADDLPLHFVIGDRLYVRETFAYWPLVGEHAPIDGCTYRATDDEDWEGRMFDWIPSIHMPRWASRLTLTVTDVRVQRLQDISEADALAEGRGVCPSCGDSGWINSGPDGGWQCNAYQCGDSDKDWFADLWNSINGPDAWAANPWVVALTFDVHRCNIDRMEARND